MENLTVEFLESSASGLKKIQMHNWSGACLALSRDGLTSAIATGKLQQAGVYILVGRTVITREASCRVPKIKVYVGRSDNLGKRLKRHLKKSFWLSAFCFYKTSRSLHAGELASLETHLILRANQAVGVISANIITPRYEIVADEATKTFAGHVETCLQALGYDLFTVQKGALPNVTKLIVDAGKSATSDSSMLEQKIFSFCKSLPNTRVYETKVPDTRAEVVGTRRSRVFLRIERRKDHLRVIVGPRKDQKIEHVTSEFSEILRNEIASTYKRMLQLAS